MFDFAGQDFDVILADPPWSFSGNSAARPGRNVRRHYPTMTVAEVAAMPVREIAAPRPGRTARPIDPDSSPDSPPPWPRNGVDLPTTPNR